MSKTQGCKAIAAGCFGLMLAIIAGSIMQACKLQKNISQSSAAHDSTALQQTSIQQSIVQIDTGKNFFLQHYFNINQSSSLSIGKISKTEEETPELAATLRFSINSLQAQGDTLSTTSIDGTKISIYTDKKTGEQVASVTKKSGKKTTFEIEDIKLKSAKTIDSGNSLQATTAGSSTIANLQINKTDSIQVSSAQNIKTKDVVRKETLFSKIGIIATIAVVLAVVFLVYKYWNKIKMFLKL